MMNPPNRERLARLQAECSRAAADVAARSAELKSTAQRGCDAASLAAREHPLEAMCVVAGTTFAASAFLRPRHLRKLFALVASTWGRQLLSAVTGGSPPDEG